MPPKHRRRLSRRVRVAALCAVLALVVVSTAVAARPSGVQLRVSVPAKADRGEAIVVRGTLGRSAKRRTVVLQRWTGTRWEGVSHTRTKRRFALPTRPLYDSPVLRVAVRDGKRRIFAATKGRRVAVPGRRQAAPSLSLVSPNLPSPNASPVVTPPGPTDHRVVTRLRRPDGTEFERSFAAYLDTPTNLNVDDDFAPDLVATLVAAPGGLRIDVRRLAGDPAPLPVEVRAELAAVVPGRDRIVLGYDARGGDAPETFSLGADRDDLAAARPAFDLALAQTGAGPLALVASSAPFAVRVTYADAPDRAAVRADFADGLAYTGDAVDELAFDVRADAPLYGRARVLAGRLVGVPGAVALDLADGVDATGAVGRLELLAASDPAATLGLTGERAELADTPDAYRLAVRAIGVDALGFGAGDGARLALDRSAAGPFAASVTTATRRAALATTDLPATADLALDLDRAAGRAARAAGDGPALTYRGDPLGALDVDVTSTDALLGAARVLDLHLEDVPSRARLTTAGDATSASVTVTDPDDAAAAPAIGVVELAAAPTAADLALPAGDGVRLETEDGSPYRIGVRGTDVGKLAASVTGGTLGLTTRTAAGALAVDAATDALDATATLTGAPAATDLAYAVEAGELTYTGAAPATAIDLTTTSATRVTEVGLEDVPTTFAADLDRDADAVGLTATGAVGRLDLRERAPAGTFPAVPDGEAGVRYGAATGALALRAFAPQQIEVALAPLAVTHRAEGGRRFTVAAGDGARDASVRLDRAPAVATLGLGDDGALAYAASAPADALDVALTGVTGVLPGADRLAFEAEKLPQKLRVDPRIEDGELYGVSAEARNASDVLTPTGQLRFGTGATLPADTYDAATGTATGNDSTRLEHGLAQGRLTGLKRIVVNVDPITLAAEMTGGRKLDLGVTTPTAAATRTVTATIDALPSTLALALADAPAAEGGGTKLTWDASSAISQIALAASGVEVLDGADSLQADVRGVPTKFTVALPDQAITPKPPLAKATVTGANLTSSGGPRIDELRLAAGSGSLPASGGNDKLTYLDGSTLNVGIKLSNLKGLSLNLDPVNTTIDQEDTLNGGTKTLDLNASLPNETGPPATVTGQLAKPSFHTELSVAVPPEGSGQPKRLTFVNGTAAVPRTMGALSLNLQNVGAIKSAVLGLRNASRTVQVCLADDGACRPTDRLPTALSNYTPNVSGSPSQNATAAGQNRPYTAQASLDLNDFGTSGTSAATSAMMELDLALDTGDGTPITLTDVFFHRLAFDLGQNGTFPAFSTDVPRLYTFVDSANKPFVANSIKLPTPIGELELGTSGSAATADRRLAWLPGGKCGGSIVFGSCVGVTVLDTRASGAHDCGGRSALTIGAGTLGTVDALNYPLVGQLVPLCS